MSMATIAVACLILGLGLAGSREKDAIHARQEDPKSAAESLNSRTGRINSVYCPRIRMGLAVESSFFYDKCGDMLFSTRVFGQKEATIGCSGQEYWFWIRSFDKKNVYSCDRNKLANTPLRPVMRPEVLSAISWSRTIGPEDQVMRFGNSLLAASKVGVMDIVIEFDSEKIISQSVLNDGLRVVTMRGGDYREISGVFMPRKIKITWHEEELSEEFLVDDWEINGERMEISKPKGMGEINLEGLDSSS